MSYLARIAWIRAEARQIRKTTTFRKINGDFEIDKRWDLGGYWWIKIGAKEYGTYTLSSDMHSGYRLYNLAVKKFSVHIAEKRWWEMKGISQ